MILSLLATSAWSAACERSFSTYANRHTAKRNRLTTNRAGKFAYILQNLKLSSTSAEGACLSVIQRLQTWLTFKPSISNLTDVSNSFTVAQVGDSVSETESNTITDTEESEFNIDSSSADCKLMASESDSEPQCDCHMTEWLANLPSW